MKYFFIIFLAGFFLLGCQKEEGNPMITIQSTPLTIQSDTSLASNLVIAPDGTPVLSWIEKRENKEGQLVFSKLNNNIWSTPQEVARGNNWFINWADFPSITFFKGNKQLMAAHWLQKRDIGTFDYDVRVAISKNGGQDWSASFVIHRDEIAAEHGFVTMLPLNEEAIFATWLDGRNTKTGAEASDGHHGGGPMTLRAAQFDKEGQLSEEVELDNKICDCCQTDAALCSKGPVVVYRDRSEEEIRDIYIVRKVDGKWTQPKAVFEDGWSIHGCPVNGPAIAANGDQLAVAWFTMANDTAKVKVAFSSDAGESFGQPIRIDDGNPIGRVDVLWRNETAVLITWIEELEEGAEVRMKILAQDEHAAEGITLSKVASSRKSGFPIIEKSGNQYLLSWTGIEKQGQTKVQSMRFTIE